MHIMNKEYGNLNSSELEIANKMFIRDNKRSLIKANNPVHLKHEFKFIVANNCPNSSIHRTIPIRKNKEDGFITIKNSESKRIRNATNRILDDNWLNW